MASALDKQVKLPVRGSLSGVRSVTEPDAEPSSRQLTQGTLGAFELPFQHGEVIGGKYKVIRLIGTGGVGFVVSARHIGFDEIVALKFLRPEFSTHTEAVTRFTIEARASFKIKSEHVARVIDVDSLPDGTPFIAMELLEGTDMRSLLDRCRVLPIASAVDYALQTCEALAAAHAQHIIHRDIKPENLFLSGQGEPADQIKVLDFGISKVALEGPKRQTQPALTRVAVGTPPYMSPEQVRASSDLDARADIWSVGCVLYEFLTGTAPFDRMSLMQSCAAVLEEEPVPPRDLRLPIPLELDAVVMRCLRKDPQERYQDVAELAQALVPFASERFRGYAQRCRDQLSCESTGRRPTMTSSLKRPPVSPPPSTPANSVHPTGQLGLPQQPPTDASSVEASEAADLRTTRPTLLLSDVLTPQPRTRLLPVSLALGAVLAFAGAYTLSHGKHAPHTDKPSARAKVAQPSNTTTTTPAPTPPAARVTPQPIAAPTHAEAPPQAATQLAASEEPRRTLSARKAKSKARTGAARKTSASAGDPDVGF